MPFQRDRYDAWIRSFFEPRYPELVEPFKQVLDDGEHIPRSGALELQRLYSILDCARSPKETLSNNADSFFKSESKVADQQPTREQTLKQIEDLEKTITQLERAQAQDRAHWTMVVI